MSQTLTTDPVASLRTLGRPRGSRDGAPLPITRDLSWVRTGLVNVVFLGATDAGDRGWVLVDTGIPGFTSAIIEAAAQRFGPDARPAAIILTHGHFDHTGSAAALADRWDVPVYAHRLELPYLTGASAYPPPDGTVGGGVMARVAMLYPRGPIDLGERVLPLPDDGTVPGAAAWKWINTAGHAPGHVSLFRGQDRALVAGDAFVTTKQESFASVWTQRIELHGPPMYFTPDWDRARASVRMLAELQPAVAITGHGVPLQGEVLRRGLQDLADGFDDVARPAHGRYARVAAVTDESGVVALPPSVTDPLPFAVAAAVAAFIGVWLVTRHGTAEPDAPRDRRLPVG